jgi:hypothetical protein
MPQIAQALVRATEQLWRFPLQIQNLQKQMGVDTGSTFPIGEGHLTLSWMP